MDPTSPTGNGADGRSVTPWWRGAYGYEVYIRSFADGNGDGIGDLIGLRERLGHLAALGIEVVWITPFYPSPMADWGYDVADYCDVNPVYGDLDDFDALLDAAHQLGLRVVIDLVPNHTSDQHEWFRDALADPAGARRDHYIWADPGPDGGPPNNWVSYFGGPAWTLDPRSGQYYLHLFLPEQPDLNWRSPAVRDEFDAILRFWLDRGVDGFRIDVAQALVKAADLSSNPQLGVWDPGAERWHQWETFEHRHDVHQPETLEEVYPRWRAIVEEYDAMLLGETYVLDAAELADMLRGDGLHAGFWFSPMHMAWDADAIRRVVRSPLAVVADPSSIAWVTSSHDEVRAPSRFGGGEEGRRRAFGLATLLAGLPGMPFLYQGEELGLLEGEVPVEASLDPIGSGARDGCRTPMPWSEGVAFGFSANPHTWLPDGGRTIEDTVAWQRDHVDSWFHRYRRLVALRRATPELRSGLFEWVDGGSGPVIALARRRSPDDAAVVVALNTADFSCPCAAVGEVLFSTVGRAGTFGPDDRLEPAEAVVVRTVDQ
jgi:alpha-glucosidase